MSLDGLMKNLANGDVSAFAGIYEKTKKAVYYTALSILRDFHLAEDVMQSTYLKVINNADSYRAGTDAAAWIKRISRNEALNLKKKREHESYVDENQSADVFGTVQPDDYGLLIDLARKILAEDEFEVLILVASAGYKRREVAELLGMPLSTVTYKLICATQKMSKALQE